MKKTFTFGNKHRASSPYLIVLMVLIVLSLLAVVFAVANAGDPLDIAGFLDFSYGLNVKPEPTAEKPESKLWWNDGFWWAILYSDTAGEYRIHRLDWGEQTWEDTGVTVDGREDARADVLWDNNVQKLYVVSHIAKSNPSHTSNPDDRAKFYRFGYDMTTQTYTQEVGPVTINEDKTESLVMDKDSTGRLWITFAGYDPDPSIDLFRYTVQVNYSTNDGVNWATQFRVPVPGNENYVALDDISSLIAFTDSEGPKIGVMWSNQVDGHFYFATHLDSTAPNTGWELETVDVSPYLDFPNDHINLAKTSSGQVFAALKTEDPNASSSDPLIALVVRDADGSYSFHTFSDVASNDTRPIVVVNDTENKVYLFVTSNPAGGRICYKTATIVSPGSGMSFAPGNCLDVGIDGATMAIADSGYDNMINPTSTKQNVNATSGLVVMAADDINGQVYAHEAIGNPPPVITARYPEQDAVDVPLDALVQATFSKAMKSGSFTPTTFQVEEGGTVTVAGTREYDNISRMETFTPQNLLKANTDYTVTVTQGVMDTSNQPLFKEDTWTFTTAAPTVQFAQASYSVGEAIGSGVATISVTLSAPSSQEVTVDFETSNGTATAGSDYTATSETLTFPVGETLQTVEVPILDDGTAESNEIVNLTLSIPTNAVLGDPSSAKLTILDDDGPPTVQFQPAAYVINEAAGSVDVKVSLSHTSADTITVDYATSDGTAKAGDDYEATFGTLTFNPGDLEKTFSVSISPDSLDEPNETINLTLSNPTNADLGVPDDKATITINDDDPTVSVMFSLATYSVNEDAGNATITVNLNKASGFNVNVDYATSVGTATPGADYTPVNGTLTFLAGETSKTFDVPIINQALDEPLEETVNLTLDNAVNALLGTPKKATLKIVDVSPPPTLQFSAASYTVNETDPKVTVTLTLSAPSGQSVAVDFATSDGTATAGDDYTAVAQTIIFLPGETTKNIDIPIKDDSSMEGLETINLTLTNLDDADLGTPGSSVIKIIDDEAPGLLFLPMIFQN